ncbi:hypothetical protein RUND412_009787 [Rhizina undulata]
MEGLPAEILQQIVGYLSEEDLDSVRLVNHELSAAANVFKYRVLRVRITREGLDHLLHVSRQPELARCVREIAYPWCLSPPMNHIDFLDAVEEDLEALDPTNIATLNRLSQEFVEWYFDTIYTAQLELENSRECVVALETALARMSNIRVLCPGYPCGRIKKKFNDWRRTLAGNGSHIIDINWNFLGMNIMDRQTTMKDDRVTKHFLDLLDVSYRVGLKPYKIGSTTSTWPNTLSPEFFADSPGILRNCAPLLANLTSISFYLVPLIYAEDVEAFQKVAKEGRMHNFLSSAPNLRSLSLRFDVGSYCPRGIAFGQVVKSVINLPRFSLLDILGSTRIWKQLHTFRLHTNTIDSEELAHFLMCYSSTLKDLSMDVCTLFGGPWRPILDLLNQQFHLKKFKLQCYEQWLRVGRIGVDAYDSWPKMEAYVLQRGPPFPPTEMGLEEETDGV